VEVPTVSTHAVRRISLLSAALLLLVAGLAAAGLVTSPGSRAVSRSANAAAATTYSLGFAGDTGGNANTAATLDAARLSGLSAFFSLGDMSYNQVTPESGWCSFVGQHAGSAMAYELVAGNHEDGDGPDGLWSAFANCLPDKLGATGTYPRQYYVDYPASSPLVRLIMVSPKLTFSEGSTYWSYKTGTQGYAFTSSAIDDARSAGIPFVVVGMHMYCVSMVNYPCAASPDLMNLLVKKRVDVYLQAHDHAYARSKQLAFAGTCAAIAVGSFNPDCVADANPSSSYVAGAGTVLATVGTGGRSLNKQDPNKPEAPYFQAYMGSNNNPTYGFLRIDVTGTTLKGTFVRGAGGTYTDTFTLTRPGVTASPSPTNSPTATPTDSASPTQTPTPTPTPTSSPTSTPTGSTTVTLTPTADSWVDAANPGVNFGSDAALYVDGSPVKVSYLKFDLSSLAGRTVTDVRLRFTTTAGAYSGSPDRQYVEYVADTSWTEAGLTYANRPAVGAALASISGTTSGTTYQLQLTSGDVQPAVGGLLSLAMDSAGSDAFYFGSRESTTPPALIITYQ